MKQLREIIRENTFTDESVILEQLLDQAAFTPTERQDTKERATALVQAIRDDSDPSIMELFLGEYGLSSDEGVALMCLAEALLRVPDSETIDKLIEDKIVPSEWGTHLGRSHSPLINASTWALYLTGKVLDDEAEGSVSSLLHGAIKRVGEPVIRSAVTRAMKEMGRQFVLGETIETAMKRARDEEARGYGYSYDMLGEAAKTAKDAKRYHIAYADAISELAKAAHSEDVAENPGISIKLSALHPRYEPLQKTRVRQELAPRVLSLASLAKSAGIGLNIDAEEADRLDLSLDIIEAVLSDPSLKDWDGFGVVVQAYSKRAGFVLDWLYALAEKLDRKIMVRLVKGAYWDTEIKLAQVEGHAGFPVFTQKPATDVSYLACARKLFAMTDRIYPQFATHNAHSVAAILEMAPNKTCFEFQRLHGMGEALHQTVLSAEKTRCRIYAPVGAHKDLLAYLVRRLLENGANSSFVNQIVDENVPPEAVAADPIKLVEKAASTSVDSLIAQPAALFAPERENSKGYDLGDLDICETLERSVAAIPLNWKAELLSGKARSVINPATLEKIGDVKFATAGQARELAAKVRPWTGSTALKRAEVLRKTADLYEENATEIFALLANEAGKTIIDAIGELREAVDFLRYYAAQAEPRDDAALGVLTCISPWNFPLAIFTGQIAAALAAGNGVIAKPAEATSLIADFAVRLMQRAGVPQDVLVLIAGEGQEIGPALTTHSNVSGVCFTGSTLTAQNIHKSMASHLSPEAPLIAETGGLNAMIVDSTALPEQAVTDIVASAFQSAGQRCSALRVLYVQDDVADAMLEMLSGAMDQLRLGNPLDFATDIGPIIDAPAKAKIDAHIETARKESRLLKQIEAPEEGTFVGPALIAINGIKDLNEEIFGPVLHIVRFDPEDLDQVISDVNGSGYGLTFGLHTRIDDRVQYIIDHVTAGNIYINRNQIGAVVGSQPFGGHGLSGTGPKAGGPLYLERFYKSQGKITPPNEQQLAGPTGEANSYRLKPKTRVLCLGPGEELAKEQAAFAQSFSCENIVLAPDMAPDQLEKEAHFDAVLYWGDAPESFAKALANRDGPIVQISGKAASGLMLLSEQVVCVDTTASGGNADLLAAASDPSAQ